jgi:hypothetical protein
MMTDQTLGSTASCSSMTRESFDDSSMEGEAPIRVSY